MVNTELKVASNKISLYPSQFSNILNIKATENKEYHFQLFNPLGQMIRSGQFINNQTDLSFLNAGVYLIRINNSEAAVKIIKQ
ncbi:T9SS type A sorting domain-containing protein [Chryseobacterium sp. CBSDS_008]|uniref:T9SS type A sorting domain-containing protein n=1 Tax=Chryseobacterium sp. CBSDS_008 TaxID=3415265 RepID=UPI003CF46891